MATFNAGSEAKILEAFEACLSRGNLIIDSDDPVSVAMWIGCSQLLHDWSESRQPVAHTSTRSSGYVMTTSTAPGDSEGK